MDGCVRPVVGIPCDVKALGTGGLIFQTAGEKYVRAAAEAADALPLLVPALPAPVPAEEVLAHLDGLLLTGAPSNVHPDHYGGAAPRPGTLLDAQRDATALRLIRAALEIGLPLLGICRGFQELNVALGGTLHQHLHEVEGRFDHREDSAASTEARYGPAHPVRLLPGGVLARLIGRDEIMVNSLHGQGIDRLAERLCVEAVAEDGTIEAVRVTDAPGFAIGVQWHPEWKALDNPASLALFAAFGEAMRRYREERSGPERRRAATEQIGAGHG